MLGVSNRTTSPVGIAGLWYACPFRWQLIVGVLFLTLVAGLLGGVLAVLDARVRASVETRANIALWKQHIGERTKEVQSLVALGHFAASLSAEMRNVRHVSVRVLDMAGNLIAATPNALTAKLSASIEPAGAPDWFLALVQPEKQYVSLNLIADGAPLGKIILQGEPADEIAEAWELLEQMALLWIGVMIVQTIGLYFLLGHILNPLVTLAGGLHELEDGHYGYRMEQPKVKELALIATSFNTLAQALDEANAENSSLYRQLVAVQEDERRQLSRDLHDEFGPCVFGLAAGLGTIERQARQVTGPEQQAILTCVNELSVITTRLRSLTRTLLGRLRPVALGRVTLAELVTDLVLTFQRRHPEVRFEQHVADLPASLGESLDVTIYRAIQEGLTNALRHGKPTVVTIEIARADKPEESGFKIAIRDNGSGLPQSMREGYGLSGMRERVRALGGALVLEPAPPMGTLLTISLPFPRN